MIGRCLVALIAALALLAPIGCSVRAHGHHHADPEYHPYPPPHYHHHPGTTHYHRDRCR